MPELGPEIPRVEEIVDEEHQSNRYGRLIAIATVLTTMIAALVAYAQAGALKTHDLADARAETYGALALEAGSINRGRADVQVDRLNLLTQQVRAADNASLFQQYGNVSATVRLTAARWNAIAAQTRADTTAIARAEGISPICSPSLQPHCPATSASYSPQQDASFPARYLQQSQWSAYRLTALRDAANEEADDAESQFVHYAAALTMLAVAVFLFGYSLTPQGRTRRVLYSRLATGFVLVAGAWALFQALSPVSHPPDSAATAFANAEVELNTGNYTAAISDFNHVLALRPRFVDAYHDRATAEYAAGIPKVSSTPGALPTTAGPATIPTIAALKQAVDDNQRARDEGSGSATVIYDLGTDLFYLGVLERSALDLRGSRDDLEQAATTFKSQDNATSLQSGAYLKIAAEDVALGDPDAAVALRRAVTQLHASDARREDAVARALTDLSLIETVHPQLAGKAHEVAQQLIAAGETSEPTLTGKQPKPGAPPVQLRGVTLEPDAGHALYIVKQVGNLDPDRDVLSAQWEYKDPLHGEWAVLPEISGPVNAGDVIPVGNGFASNNVSYVSRSSPATCLPPGQYKVDFYVNGQLAGTATTRATWPALHAVRFSAIDGAVCVPTGWVPLPPIGAGADGYLARDGSGGAMILSIPKAATGALANDQPGLAKVMQSFLQGFSGSGGLLPGLASAGKPTGTPFFMSSVNGQQQQWTYNHGVVLTGVGTAANGQIYVGLAWGPPNGELANDLFLSLSPL